MTTVEITYSCGHAGPLDLSKKRRDQHAGFKRWASEKLVCSECFAESGDEKRAEFLAKLDADREHWEATAGLPPLDGPSEKAILWGHRSRFKLLQAAWEDLDLSEAEYSEAIVDRAILIRAAGWWIDQRDEPIADLPEILAAWQPETDEHIATENPYV